MTLTVEDRLEIQDLYARYCHTVDAFDGDGWASCFAEDGSLVPSVGTGTGTEYRGRVALAAFAADRSRHALSRHWINNLLLTDHGDHVRGTCYAQLVDISGATPKPVAHVSYDDVLVREGGRWLFATRRPKRDC